MAKLTSKELGLLEDNLRQEQVMVQKFDFYAHQASDPEIKSLCQNLRDMHKRHLDVLMKHLDEAITM